MAEVDPFHAQAGVVERDGLVLILRSILRIVDSDAQVVGSTQFGFRELYRERRFGLAVGEGQGTYVENTVSGTLHDQRDRDGTAGVLTHGGEGGFRRHRRIESVAARSFLRREIDAVATADILFARGVRVYLRLAGEEERKNHQ